MINNLLSNNIQVLRKAAGLNQRDLELLLDIEKNNVSNWERGKNSPNKDTLNNIATLFKISLDDLMKKDMSGIQYDKIKEMVAHLKDPNSYISQNHAEMALKKPGIIPLLRDARSFGGIKNGAAIDDGIKVNAETEFINVGGLFVGATAAIFHFGESMIEYPEGCILILREINNFWEIDWGKNYTIEVPPNYPRLTKKVIKIKAKPGFIKALSTNKQKDEDGELIHQPIEIKMENIRRIFLILGFIKQEFSSTMIFNLNQ